MVILIIQKCRGFVKVYFNKLKKFMIPNEKDFFEKNA